MTSNEPTPLLQIGYKRIDGIQFQKQENSFLLARNSVFLNYNKLLVKYLISKSLNKYDEDLCFEIIKQQQILSKTKQIQEKLKYIINRELQPEKPVELQHKPNFKKFIKIEKNDTYKPPRLAPLSMGSGPENREKMTGKEREIASKSRLLQDLQIQFQDTPEEQESSGLGFKTERDGGDERREFEEENFIRLQETRKSRKEEIRNQKHGSSIKFKNEFDDLQKDFRQLKSLRVDSKLSRSATSKRKGQDLLDDISKKKTKNEFKSVRKVFKAFKK